MNTYSLNTPGTRTDQAMARNMKLLAHHELEGNQRHESDGR